jgi:hypothetical protein
VESCDEELLLQSSIEERNWLSPNPPIKLVPASISVLFLPRRKIIRSSDHPIILLSQSSQLWAQTLRPQPISQRDQILKPVEREKMEAELRA